MIICHLSEIMKERGDTLKDCLVRCRLKHTQQGLVQRMLYGEPKEISLPALASICRGYGVLVSDVYEYVPDYGRKVIRPFKTEVSPVPDGKCGMYCILAELLRARGINAKEAAAALDVPYGTIIRMSQNKTSHPKREVIDKICRFFHVDVGELFLLVCA